MSYFIASGGIRLMENLNVILATFERAIVIVGSC